MNAKRTSALALLTALTVAAPVAAQDDAAPPRPGAKASPSAPNPPVAPPAAVKKLDDDSVETAAPDEAPAEDPEVAVDSESPVDSEDVDSEDDLEDAEVEVGPSLDDLDEPEADADDTPSDIGPSFTVGQCVSSDVADVLATRRRSVVRIEAPGAAGLGFVFESKRYVATALSVVDTGRGVRVVFDDGRRVSAEVVAADEKLDIAILKLSVEAPAAPIPAGSDAAVGDPVVTLAVTNDFDSKHPMANHPKMKRRRWKRLRSDRVVQPGVITGGSGERLRADALDGRHMTWGAPVLDCKGRVVGIATTPFTDELVSVSELKRLADEGDPGYSSGWSVWHPTFTLNYQFDHGDTAGYEEADKWLGFSAGSAIIGHDRWYFPARFSAAWLVGPKPESQFSERDAFRVQGSLAVGYRAMLWGGRIPVYLVPQFGGVVSYQRETYRQTDFVLPEACDAGPCSVTPVEYELTLDEWRALPSFAMGLQIGFGEMRYEFQLDTDDVNRSIHQLSAGVQF